MALLLVAVVIVPSRQGRTNRLLRKSVTIFGAGVGVFWVDRNNLCFFKQIIKGFYLYKELDLLL